MQEGMQLYMYLASVWEGLLALETMMQYQNNCAIYFQLLWQEKAFSEEGAKDSRINRKGFHSTWFYFFLCNCSVLFPFSSYVKYSVGCATEDVLNTSICKWSATLRLVDQNL